MDAEDRIERTEPATPRRRQESRERGQVPRSRDLTAALALLAAFLGLELLAGPALRTVGAAVSGGLSGIAASGSALDAAGASRAAGAALALSVQALLPLALLVLAAGVAGGALQTGLVASWGAVAPDAGRLSPMRGLERIFSLRSCFRGGLSLVKAAVVGAVLLYALWREWVSPAGGAPALLSMPLGESVPYLIGTAAGMGIRAALALLALGLLDHLIERWLHRRDLRMTRREVKEERRRAEGDPRVRERLRRARAELRGRS